jgi:AcrR family transcriptional regulator
MTVPHEPAGLPSNKTAQHCTDTAPDAARDGSAIAGPSAGVPGANTISRRGRPSIEDAQRLPARILEAGWEVLREHGFEAFTFDRVARHAHIGKATIYTRFPSKREFLEALLAHKSTERSLKIMSTGAGLPAEEVFCLRAAAIMEVLQSTDGLMMERLVDWCDQEFGDNQYRYRHAMYADAIENVSVELAEISLEQGIPLANPEQAARFWIEGVLGHVRMAGAAPAPGREENELWARDFSAFFFAGLRNATSLTRPDASPGN